MPLMGTKNFKYLNKRVGRMDGAEKITGKAVYAADLKFPGMIYGGCLRSGLSHAKIVSIETSKAKAIKGVHAVLTASDVPKPVSWATYPYLCEGIVRFVGETVAIVAAETRELVEEALKAIEVVYQELPGVFTIEEALKEGAARVKESGVGLKDGLPDKTTQGNVFLDSYFPLRKGDVEKGFAQADIIIEREYRTPYVEHSYIEPEACVVTQDPVDGAFTAHASAQNPYFTRRYLADAVQAPINKCRVVQRMLGGSFGGKEELVGLIVGRAALLAKASGRPVKMVVSREESFLESPKRHPFIFRYKAGLTRDGRFTAWEGMQIDNCGAYTNQTQFMNCRASIHSAGVYKIPNIKTDTYGVFTNNIHSGAMRGYSSPQIIFAQEQFINEIAREMGIDNVEFRRKNILQKGDFTATGQELVEETITLEMIDQMVERTDYYRKKGEYEKTHGSREKRKGIALVSCYRGCGYGAETPDAGAALCTALEDGTIIISSGLAENGQGLKTAYSQIAAEGIGCTPDRIFFPGVDTHAIPDSGMTVASRGTVMGAQSMRKASIELGNMLLETAAQMLGVRTEKVEMRENSYFLKDNSRPDTVSLAAVCNTRLWTGKSLAAFNWSEPKNLGIDHHTGQGDAFPTYSYGVVVAEVEVDLETGFVDVLKVSAGHDLGTCVNPATSEGQIFGGIAMGQGFGVTEEVPLDKGHLEAENFDSYIFPTSMDVPEMEAVIFECEDKEGTYGAKSLGEPATEAVGAAIAAAVAHAKGEPVRELPCNLERTLLGRALKKE
ncbi:MAG: xanthine dehydrogenase family protein [Spirochaetales bacterium]|nr:xanthine dehydrogenase family protein [Spirochaetales bacterium]